MSERQEEYRRQAKEAEQRAEEAIMPDVRMAWHEVARHWHMLADQHERQKF